MSGTKSSASASSSSKAASKEEKKEKEEDEMKVVVSAAEKEEKEDLKTTTENVADEDEDEEKKASNKSKTKSTSDVQRLPRPSREKHETAMKRLNEQIEERKKTIEFGQKQNQSLERRTRKRASEIRTDSIEIKRVSRAMSNFDANERCV